MRTSRNLNFLPVDERRLRLLQGSVLVVLGLCGVTAWLAAGLPGSGAFLAATIGDTVGTEPIASASPTPLPAPKTLTDVPAFGLDAGPDGLFLFVEETTGRLLSADARSGLVTPVADRKIPGILDIQWAYGNRAYLHRAQGGGTRFWVFLRSSDEISPLASSIVSLAVSADGNRTVVARAQNKHTSIELTDTDGQTVREILRTRAEDPVVEWPTADSISLTTGDGAARSIVLISLDGVIRPLVRNFANLEHLWSPQGKSALISYDSDEGSVLSVLDIETRIELLVPLPTSARKCAWAGENRLICGVPEQEGQLAGSASDSVATKDVLVSFDLERRIAEPISAPAGSQLLSVIDPVIDSRSRWVAFRNLYDRLLYAIPLP